MSNSIDLALLLDNRFIEVNPEFLTVHWNPRYDDATVWLAIQTPVLKCLDKDHQKLSFRMLDAHITLAYPSVTLWAVAGRRSVDIVSEWIVERQQRSANGSSFYGMLEWHENRMTHDRFTCLDIRYDMRDGLDYWLRELSRRLQAEFSQFPSRDRFHISFKNSKRTLCEFVLV